MPNPPNTPSDRWQNPDRRPLLWRWAFEFSQPARVLSKTWLIDQWRRLRGLELWRWCEADPILLDTRFGLVRQLDSTGFGIRGHGVVVGTLRSGLVCLWGISYREPSLPPILGYFRSKGLDGCHVRIARISEELIWQFIYPKGCQAWRETGPIADLWRGAAVQADTEAVEADYQEGLPS